MSWTGRGRILLKVLALTAAMGLGNETIAEDQEDAKKPVSKGPFTENMSEEQKAWEAYLEGHLGGYHWPRYLKFKREGIESAYDYVNNDPALPRVLLIGDSISRGYTLPVRHALAGKANVHRAPENCGSTVTGLGNLSLWLGDGKWDVIHFNFGIHNRTRPLAEYGPQLEQIVQRLKKTGARLVWASTIPSPEGLPEHQGKKAVAYMNAVAQEIMKKHGVTINDLHAHLKPKLAEHQPRVRDFHLTDEGYEYLGQAVARAILAELAAAEGEN